ncbi:hypothetical protein M8J75_001321 [Diaphorina citri]|nr:hypothetical protein M8J75_000806 [Diaphorina citri]KAI5698070.1 hypothetical protein M8J75_001252 [Diaphorina citri]KAI5698074.1 hypothetical protein M8J75_001321 [Diaphorina citri]KAI5727474.1 hypothetical protein M8J77_002838 [Diaphorina citri]KAI5728115.1 hypothetical protein M8J77_011746 [Diaphorina citri]
MPLLVATHLYHDDSYGTQCCYRSLLTYIMMIVMELNATTDRYWSLLTHIMMIVMELNAATGRYSPIS